MSGIRNGEGYPVQGTSNSMPIVDPKISPSQYPSLICMQCHERSLIEPVLPTAPYPVTPVLEHVSYPRLPMPQVIQENHYLHQPNRIYNVEELLAMSNSKRPTVSTVYEPEVEFVTEELTDVQTPAVLSEIEDRGKDKCTKKYCSKICWMVVAFLILMVIGAVVLFQLYMQDKRMRSQIDQEWVYGHKLLD